MSIEDFRLHTFMRFSRCTIGWNKQNHRTVIRLSKEERQNCWIKERRRQRKFDAIHYVYFHDSKSPSSLSLIFLTETASRKDLRRLTCSIVSQMWKEKYLLLMNSRNKIYMIILVILNFIYIYINFDEYLFD